MELIIDPFHPLFSISFALAVSVSLNVWLLSSAANSRQTPPSSLTSVRELPQGWWTDAERFQAERRAIFSQTWMCVSHRGRFKKAGDYVVYEAAGFRFFMIMGKDDVVRAFHNVCRHRAFPVARKQAGSSTILGCRYHGWSYDTKGKLTKAPFFEDVPGFQKSEHSLFEILTKEDSYGFLHINVSTSKEAASSSPRKVRKIGKPTKIDRNVSLLHTFEMKGKFNWKLTVDIEGSQASSEEATKSMFNMATRSLTPMGQLHFFPVTTVHTKSGRPFWYQLTYSPVSAHETALRCDVYSVRKSDNQTFDGAVKDELERELDLKIQAFEAAFVKLKGSNHHLGHVSEEQVQIAKAVDHHIAQEKLEGKEIKPAAVKQPPKSEATVKAEQICQAMECGNEKMDW